MTRRVWRSAAAGLAVALALAGAGASARPHAAGVTFRSAGSFVLDAGNRVRIFHGVNAVWKIPPYYPPSTDYPAPFAATEAHSYFDARDADFLASNGLNLVRLGVLWAGVEPRYGVFDTTYVDRIRDLVQMLGARGVDVLLDFHQDMANERYQGEGFPAWASTSEVPPTNCCGFPGNYFTPAVMRTFDHLWNQAWLRNEYAKSWAFVAAGLKDEPNVLGYDLMNEPWPGSQIATCANPLGCPVFQNLRLQPFLEASAKAIRAAGGPGIAFWEPDVTNDFGAGDTVGLVHAFADPSNGISFHAYCLAGGLVPGLSRSQDPACPHQESLVFTQQGLAAKRNHSVLLLTEFGASDELPDISRVAALADANMTGWTYWHYGSWSDPTGNPSDEGMFNGDLSRPATLKQAKADVLIRAYPQAVAGVPMALSYDLTTHVLRFTYDADPAHTSGPTVIFVPVTRPAFAAGYTVSVAGPGLVTSSADAAELTIAASAPGVVTVTVTPR